MEILNLKKSGPGAYEVGTFDLDMGPKWGVIHRHLKICRAKSGHLYVKGNSYKNDSGEWKTDFEFYGENGGPFKVKLMETLNPLISSWSDSSVSNDAYYPGF